ncbi:MAG TPA: putative lipid II flippase FtsW [Pricia sp.]|nr:putative lipid II flippase FtsW [Pricia sp.]
MNTLRNRFLVNTNIRSLEPANIIIYLVTTLLVIGTIMIYSTTSAKVAGGLNPFNLAFLKHILWVILAVIGMLTMMSIDYNYIQKYSKLILIIALAFLVIVLIPGIGTTTNGASRWIRFGSYFGFQPSEFAKLAMIIFMSSYIAIKQEKMANFTKGFVIPVVLIGLVSLLILKEPDLGTAIFVSLISFILMMVGGTRIVYVIFTLVATAPHIYAMIYKFQAYQKSRLLAFLDPWKDPEGIGYQIIQSWIALGSGGLTGLGLGESRQKLFFLPESNSDFIFSIIGEELGFIGATGVIIIFALLAWQGMRVCMSAPDTLGFCLSLGITLSITLQSAINIAVATGAIPTTGLPLPFISAGGSSLFLSSIGIGILLNIARQSKTGAVLVNGSVPREPRLSPPRCTENNRSFVT